MTAIASLAVFVAALASGPADFGIRFTDVTATSGVAATMTSGRLPSSEILEVKGGGLALIDFDNDGDLDLFLPNGATLDAPEHGPGAKLFRNDSAKGHIRFTDVTAASGIRHTRWSYGVAVGDVDGDGFDDLFIACFGPDVLLRNKGDGTFEDRSAASGLAAAERDREWGTGAAFADLDGDGDLDLYVANYIAFDPAHPPAKARFRSFEVMGGPKGLPAQGDRLFLNQGDGTFVDATASSGVGAAKPSYGLNVAILDFTGDGKPDIYVGNDSQANFLFKNEGSTPGADGKPVLRFSEIGLRAGIATNGEGLEQATMGTAIGDVDGNGWPDVFSTNFSSDTNTLHLNLNGTYFDDRTTQFNLAAVSRPLLGWAAAFIDFDHDGDEDLLVVNGHVYPQATKQSMDSDYEQRPLLMERRGKRFEPLSEAGAWKLEPHRDRTAVFADFDQDGDVDIAIGELNGPVRVIENGHCTGDAQDPADWLEIRLAGPKGNRHAIGSRLEVRCTTASGESLVQRRWLWGGGPFQSTLSPVAHVGIPAGAKDIAVTVTWPDGSQSTANGVKAGSLLDLKPVAK